MENIENQEVSRKFAKIPNEISSLGLEQGDVLVLAHINIHKNGGSKLCNPGMDTLSLESGYSKKFIMSSIKRLEDAKLIKVERKRGRSNVYTFTEKGKEFQRFAESFLKITDLSKNAKDFYMRIQQYLYVHELDGTADTTYNPKQLADLTDLDARSVKKYLDELKSKGYMHCETATTSTSSGLQNVRYVFSLEALGQQILYKIADHDDRITKLEKKITRLEQKDYDQKNQNAKKDKYIEYLERQLRLAGIKEVEYWKESDKKFKMG